jgi:alkylmercury lyase
MQQTQLEVIAQSVVQRQDRYQRNTPLFRQLAQLLAQGRPVAPALLACTLHLEREEVLSILRAHPELEYDEHGNIVGSGLTFRPTAHQFRMKQHTLFAWCAFDTLTYPVELHLSARITSRCPVTGRSIRLLVTPEQVLDLDLKEAHVSLVVDVAAQCCSNVREDVCTYGHFFHERKAAIQWQAAHSQALILTVEEAYQVGRLVEASRTEIEP